MGEDQFAALYRRHRSALVWHVRCHGASQAEAADAVQDAFACALRAQRQIRDPGAWPAWLRTVAVRCYLRSLARHGGPFGDDPSAARIVTMAELPELSAPHATDLPAADAERRQQEEFVLSLLAALPPRQRQVFALHYEGLNTAEIATHLGMADAAVRQNIARARAALRHWIMAESVRLGESS